jgi:hypothetical protein
MRFKALLAYEPLPSLYQSNVFYKSASLDLDLLRYVTYHWGIQLGYVFAAHRYPEPTVRVDPDGVFLDAPREDDINILRFGLLYRAFRNFHIGGGAVYRNRDSNIDGFDESRWLVTTTVGFLP